jgi:hypothetical protein
MDQHTFAILDAAETWDWPLTTRTQASGAQTNRSKFKAITAKLLSYFIAESQVLGGTLLGQFWTVFGSCDPSLSKNSGLRSLW